MYKGTVCTKVQCVHRYSVYIGTVRTRYSMYKGTVHMYVKYLSFSEKGEKGR